MTTSGSNDCATFRRALRRCAPQLRRSLPWIGHDDPWAVLVAEVMLQQTPVARVVEPWRRFLETFPTPTTCADAPLSSVLQHWEGLGYHRRAKALHQTARMIRDEFTGDVPSAVIDLLRLPGVGPYTANAVASFAFARRVAVLDTNVGRVLARALANRRLDPPEARRLATALLPRDGVASFNQALLDLGAQFCKSTPRCATCPLRRHCRWFLDGGDDPAPRSAGVSKPQSPFRGSNRQLRGLVLARLRRSPTTPVELFAVLAGVEAPRRAIVLEGLLSDGLVERRGRFVRLAQTS